MIPRDYHWDDVGAPPLNTEAGSILEIFKACLITGYGSKAGAGWKLQYDGWTAKGEQKLAFSVGDETEQELIYWLNDANDNQAKLTLWANLNATGDGVENQITSHIQPMQRENNRFKEWHLYATNKFALFLYSFKTYANTEEGLSFLFGAARDLFGEYLPQVIIQRKNAEGEGVPLTQTCISSGGTFWLPNTPFRSNNWWGGYQTTNYSDKNIEYFLPILCDYQPTTSSKIANRLYIPALTLNPCNYANSPAQPSFHQVVEKGGTKIIKFVGRNTRSVGFVLNDWDSPAWLNQIINS